VAFKLPRLTRGLRITNPDGTPAEAFMVWWDNFAKQIETQENTQDELLAAVVAAQAAADAAGAAAAVADAAAADAQTAADNAQAAVDALVVPPSTTRSVSANTALNADDVTVLVDTSGGLVTISLSNASGYSVPVVITKTAGANNVDVVPTGSDQLNGGAGPVSLTLSGETRTFVADQVSEWWA
jgi:hypothetical protein